MSVAAILLATFLAAPSDSPGAPVTWAKDVAPILQRRCQTCHRPDSVGPFSLLNYDDARGRAKMLAQVVASGAMPPWNADERFDGVFANERKLTPAEKKTLLAWVAEGAPRGDVAAEPAPKEWPAGWTIGTPDLVLEPRFEMRTQKELPAQGYAVPREGVLDYQYFVVPTGFTEDRWVQRFELLPGAKDVVHHVLAALALPSGGLDVNGFLATYVPGDTPSIYPEGYAKKIPKGASIVFQVHYTPNGKERFDRCKLGMVFASEPPLFAVRSSALLNQAFEIPPGAVNFEVRSSQTFSAEVGLLALMPHMHTRGKDFRIDARFPDGTSQELLFAHYDFDWQESYLFPDPLLMPAGTVLECVGHFDNSAANPANPDPQATVRWGEQTFEEMFVAYLDTVVPVE